MARPARFAASTLLAIGLGALVTACGSGPVVNSATLEHSIRSTLDRDPLTTVRSVSCPANVASVAGRRFTCAVVSPTGARGVVTVTVRDAQRHVRWSLTQPPAPGSGVLARTIGSDFAAHDSTDTVASTSCPAAITLLHGATTVCTIALTSGERVSATVTRDAGGGISWTYAASK